MIHKFLIWWLNREWPITINWFKYCSNCGKFMFTTRDDWRNHLCDKCDEIVPENHN